MFHLPLIVHIITRFALLFRDFSLHFRKHVHLYYSILHSIFHSIFLFFIIMTKSITKLAFSTVNQAIRKQKKSTRRQDTQLLCRVPAYECSIVLFFRKWFLSAELDEDQLDCQPVVHASALNRLLRLNTPADTRFQRLDLILPDEIHLLSNRKRRHTGL